MQIDKDVLAIVNEAVTEYVPIPNAAVAKLINKVPLYTYNDTPDSGLFDDDFHPDDTDDAEYNQEILKGEKLGVFRVEGQDVYVNDKVPVYIDYSKHSAPNAAGTIIYKSPSTGQVVFSSDLYDDPRSSYNSDELWFQVLVTDLSIEQIKDLVFNYALTSANKRALLRNFSKEDLVSLVIDITA